MQISQNIPSHIAVSMGMQAYMQQSLSSEPVRQVYIPVSVSQDNDDPTEQNPIADKVTLSPEAQEASRRTDEQPPQADSKNSTSQAEEYGLSPEEQQAVEKLKTRDREVRAHEQAHLSQAGKYAAGGMSFTYQKGPDGKRYAVGGEVPISLSEESTPEETITKMETVRNAAMAPANPSAADRQIAAQASAKANQARSELQQERAEALPPSNDDNTGNVSEETSPSESPPSSRQDSYQPLDIVA